jgi:2-alkenal reductase
MIMHMIERKIPMKKHILLLVVLSTLALSILACSVTGISLPGTSGESTQEAVAVETDVAAEPTPAAETQPATYVIPDEVLLQDTLVELYDRVSPGVVSIQVYSEMGSGLGSGFAIDKEGHIVTNYHVVQLSDEVEVHFSTGLKVYGQVIGKDLDSDIAVIKVDVDPEFLVPLPLGNSDQVRVGQTVVAIGNPYGLTGTMTVGIVSARGRTLDSIRQTASGMFFAAGDIIQTDATINPGNSGGPLLNLNGEVIGINRAIQTSGYTNTGDPINTGIGFAISSNILNLVVPSLIAGETYAYPYLGISSLNDLSLFQAELLGLSRATGAYVVEVVDGGPADEAGVQEANEPTDIPGLFAGGDLIIAIDGREILEFSELLSYMMLNKQPGDEVVLTVLRDDEEIDLTITLGERPPSP